MRITKVNIPKEDFESPDGLDYIKMDRLGQVVLLAGKNGSGKTRILNKVIRTFKVKPRKRDVEKTLKQKESLIKSIEIDERKIKQFTQQLNASVDMVLNVNLDNAIKETEQRNAEYKKQVTSKDILLNWDFVETDQLADRYSATYFVPKTLDLADCSSFTKQGMLDHANSLSAVGIDGLPSGTFSKIQVIQDRWWNATHQSSRIGEKEKAKAIDEYEKLTKLIRIFLNTDLSRDMDDQATLFGFPLGKAQLSDGQKILIQFCVALYTQENDLKDLVLVLDEPENHLHPSIIVETIDRIVSSVPNGQVWIATHSIPLLAHFDPSMIWFVESGSIKHAGKIPEKVLSSLLGDEEEIAKLKDFINLPAQYAISRHAYECLIEPPAVMTKGTDAQSIQMRNELLKISNNDRVRVLDFGAGQGRTIANIFDLDQQDILKLVEKLEYIAYDIFDTYKVQCENSITKVYGNADGKYFNDEGKLLSTYDKKSFHVVLMCNVLHEIDPKEWIRLFAKDGFISEILSDNGIVLLVEDYQMPIGEKAHQKGFLVLDTPQLKELFKITEKDNTFKVVDHRGDDRLKAHYIPKECLSRIDAQSRVASLESLSKIAKTKILNIRQGEQNYSNGKLHGFWTQQFANAQLSISEFT